jgi:hypothetical protein
MKERPILFSNPMVRALLNTKPGIWPAEPIDPSMPYKSMTRRVVKPQLDCDGAWNHTEFPLSIDSDLKGWWGTTDSGKDHHYSVPVKGDVLWVRETWRVGAVGSAGNTDMATIEYKAGGRQTIDITAERVPYYAGKARWRPSIFMPREAARLFLEVKDVGVERLQDIREEDAEAEGVFPGKCSGCGSCSGSDCYDPVGYFQDLWDTLNAKRGYSWESNLWVWVYELMRVEK